MKKVFVVAGIGMALCSTMALADPDTSNVPLEKAIETVTQQQAEHPGNEGLANARQRLITNATRQQENRQDHPGGGRSSAASSLRPDIVDRVSLDRPGLERAIAREALDTRPGRSNPPGRSR